MHTLSPWITTLAQTSAEHPERLWAYGIFLLFVLAMLALDLGVFHKHAHEVKFKEALGWSILWVTLGVLFTGVVYLGYQNHWLGLGLDVPQYVGSAAADGSSIARTTVDGATAAQQYITGYVIEKSLSMDNIFVIALIFQFLAIPGKYQHRVLFWGIVGALLMRGVMIFLGAALVMKYQWILIFFGLLLLLSAAKMAFLHSEPEPDKNIVVRFVKKLYPVTNFFDGQRFFTRRTVAPTYNKDAKGHDIQDPPQPGTLGTKLSITPLFLALIMVEITDLIFAVDSIPAIFAITPDPFIVFTSNIFAILGLRSLYFCLAALIQKFRFLKPALIIILVFVGIKLLLLSVPPYLDNLGLVKEAMNPIKIPTIASLGVVLGMLGLAVVLSVLMPSKKAASH
jgi:tellurite resistance protein TerC